MIVEQGVAFDSSIMLLMEFGFILIVLLGLFYVGRILYKANKYLDTQLVKKKEELTGK